MLSTYSRSRDLTVIVFWYFIVAQYRRIESDERSSQRLSEITEKVLSSCEFYNMQFSSKMKELLRSGVVGGNENTEYSWLGVL